MKTSCFALIMLAIFMSPHLSGCIDREPDTLAPFLVRTHTFNAEVRHVSGALISFNLTGPLEVVAPSGEKVAAYVFEQVNYKAGGPAVRQTHYLDGDLRIIASRLGCRLVPAIDPCPNHELWKWHYAGDLAPDGLGYLEHAAKGTLEEHNGMNIRPFEWEARELDDGRLRFDLMTSDNRTTSDVGTYVYTRGRMLPDSNEYTVVTYEALGRLPTIDVQAPLANIDDPVGWQGIMFPEEDSDHFGVGASHRSIVEAGFPDITTDAAKCVFQYSLAMASERNVSMLQDLVETFEDERTATARLSVIDDGNLINKEVELWRDPTDGTIRMEVSSRGKIPLDLSCLEFKRSPWPDLAPLPALAHAKTLVQSHGFAEFSYEAGVRRHHGMPPESGWQTYGYAFRPAPDSEGQSGLVDLYQARFEATARRTLVEAMVPPDGRFLSRGG